MSNRATPAASPVADAAPYGIDAIKLQAGLSPSEVASHLFQMPDEVAGLPQRKVTSDADSATVIYAIDQGVPVPRFGMAVVLKIKPSSDADTTVANLERDRWGDPKDHDVTAEGAGTDGGPAFREFSRIFPPGLFLLPNRPVFFLIWYRANDQYAFMVIGDTPTVRESLARAVAGALAST